MKRMLAVVIAVAGVSGMMAAAEEYLSPGCVVAAPDGKTLYAAAETGHAVLIYDTTEHKVAGSIALPENPSGLALSPDGARLYVTGGVREGKVFVVDTQAKTVAATWAAGHTPCAPSLAPDGKRLAVCNRFNNNVAIYDVASGTPSATVAVAREPVAAAWSPDGRLCVANLLPNVPATNDVVAAEVAIIDAATAAVTPILLPNGSSSLRGICVSPDGKEAYVTHILGHYQLPTTQLERGWMNTNALSIIKLDEKKLLATVLLDEVDLGAANPWGIACTPDGAKILVAHAGTHEISVIDRAAMLKKITDTPTDAVGDICCDLAFLVGIRSRFALKGNGPRGIAIAGDHCYATEYFTDSLGCIPLASDKKIEAASLPLGPEKAPDEIRRGAMYFNDGTLCFQHWQSCTSCHPDARADGLNWDLMNDGLGNPKNTKSMLLAHKTPPMMALAVRPSAEIAVRAGMKFVQFIVLPEEYAKAMNEFLKSLEPVPGPVSGERGRQVFEKAGCAQCHSGPYYTNLQSYDLKTTTGMDVGRPVDTPTLVEVWRTAPYLHDGRALTIREMLTKYNPDDRHGVTSNLTPEELDALEQYVLSR